jgi:PKD repeat protein
MNKIIIALGLMISAGQSFAQQNWCGTDKVLERLRTENPGFEQHMHESMSHAASGKTSHQKATLYVPVVVHIIHDNGVGNISYDQVLDAIRILNEDYNRANSDAANTRNTATAPFSPVAGSMDVEFKLAKKDPQGNCTNGVVRVNAPQLTYNANDDCKYTSNGGSDQWPMDKYLNIWVVNAIVSDGAGITLGYAYLPYWPNGTNYGILIRHDSFGSIETANNSDGRTLTHEMGHLLGLNHIFDAGWNGSSGCHTNNCNNNGDYCCDTPPQAEANWSCNASWNSCSEVPTGDAFGFDAVDQIENYMSYNSCQNMFSLDQIGIMQTNFADISFMASMVTPANIAATGINDPDVLCAADFSAPRTTICSNTELTFTDYSFHGPSSWEWTITPGVEGVDYVYTNGSSSTSQNITVNFITSGYYSVELSVSNTSGTVSEIKNNYLLVLPDNGTLPFLENFESYSTLNGIGEWKVENPGNNNAFELESTFGLTGTKCAKLINFGQPAGSVDELISAPVDLSGITSSMTLSFRYAYRKRNASDLEYLKVFVTNDCGESWVQRKTISGNTLSPITSSSSWAPAGVADWVTVHMTNITSTYWVEDFRYKFKFESDGGNNFYLDNINIYAGTPSDDLVMGLSEGSEISGVNVYPNPADQELNVAFSMSDARELTIAIVDLSGKEVGNYMIHANSGMNLVNVDTHSIAQGSYWLVINTGGSKQTYQFVKQ